jgi:hypothetical protein
VSDEALLRQLLRESEQRYELSEAQHEVVARLLAAVPARRRLTWRRRLLRWAVRETPQPSWFVALATFNSVGMILVAIRDFT